MAKYEELKGYRPVAKRKLESVGGFDPEAAVREMLERARSRSQLPPKERIDASYPPTSHPEGYTERAARILGALGCEPKVIYYPGSNLDVSWTRQYPNADVFHVDTDDGAMNDLRSAGYNAVTADMHYYVPPKQADVVCIFNAGYMSNDQLRKVTAPEAVVVVNNYHKAGIYMRDFCVDFKFAAAIEQGTDGKVQTDFDLAQLGVLPARDEIVWPAHSETILAFRKNY